MAKTYTYHSQAFRADDTVKALSSFKPCETVTINGATVKVGSASHKALLAKG